MRTLVFLVLPILFLSCGTTVPYTTDYPLTQGLFHSRDGAFSGRIPDGWFSSTDDTLASALVAWLIKDDFTATFGVREIHIDQTTARQINDEGLPLLAYISSGMQGEDLTGAMTEPEEFELRGRKHCSYELSLGGMRKRVVLFAAKGKYYECETAAVKGVWTANDLKRLFTLQQTVLASLSF